MKSLILVLSPRLSDTLACTGPLILQKLWHYHPQTLHPCPISLLHSPIHTYCTGLSALVLLESLHLAFSLLAWRKKPSWLVVDMVEEFSSPFPQKCPKSHAHYALLLEDARRYLQMGFEPMKHHCLNTYGSLLAWIPRRASIRHHYSTLFGNIPRVVVGIAESWGSAEHVMAHPSRVNAVAF